MKRTIIEVDHARGIQQWTTPDERWYARKLLVGTPDENWDFVPSVTWITSHYPKGIGFYKWLANHGWDEAEEIKASAGDKGSKVHQAISRMIHGGTVLMTDCFENPRNLELEALTPEEYICLMSFKEWWEEERPEVLANEYTVWNEHYRYAGTVDFKCRLLRDSYRYVWIIDCKISPQIWPPYKLQVSAYRHADGPPKAQRLGILQLGYKYNKKKKFKFTPIPDQFGLFLAARKIWKNEAEGIVPLQRDFPLSLSLNSVESTTAPVADGIENRETLPAQSSGE